MFTKKSFKGLAIFVSSTIFSLSTLQSAYAAPGTLASAPLFLSTIVEPNVFFTLDDSGSMDYELVVENTTAGIPTVNGLPTDDAGDRIGYLHPTWAELYGARSKLPPADEGDAAFDKYWVFKNPGGNKIYYDPSATYTPWPGAKANGDPMYEEYDPTNVPDDPNYGTQTVDLTADQNFGGIRVYLPTYYTWTDDGDGVIEQSDGHTQVEIAAGTAEMQNFANWWVYYRSRMNTTKAAIGAVINNTDATRMGMRLFNGPNGAGTAQQTDLESMSNVAKKRKFLEAFYGVNTPARGTPGRQAMQAVGNMFASNTGTTAILPQADGGECQQNFNIFMSDGFWSSGTINNIGNTDKDGNAGNDTIYDGNASQSNDGGNYADNWSDTLADVAMEYYELDLRSDLNDDVPTQSGVDEASHQHMVNYTIAFGVSGDLNALTDDPLAAGFSWPEPVAGDSTTVDDMWHAAYNSRGEYLNAQNPEEFESALGDALSNIAERTATAAAVSINSAKLTTQSVVYLAQFNTNRWQGNLFAFKIVDLDTGELSSTPEWTAADELNARNFVANPRTVMTHNGTQGVPFQWDKLSGAQKDDLKTSPTGAVDADLVGEARLEYLRGDRSNEGVGYFFRERLSLLSDLVNSGPVFVGKPALNWPDSAPFPDAIGSRYSDFKNGPAATRAGMVYAGSNGGMMHGFAEADGEEKIAYVPMNLFSTASGEGLHYLTDQNYGHRYYNDLTPTISDIYADIGNGSGTAWNTVLISGQRGGGRGIFAIDVTDPTDFSEGNADKVVLWEFTNSDDADLGFTYSRPQIAMTNESSPRWVAIFGNGYNDTGDGEAKLFIVDIARGTDGSWTGGDYIEITTNSGSTTDRNGLATPALADLDGNGTVDRVYAGDLEGQMWVFDLSSSSTASWGLSGTGPLFTTKGDMPITAKPTLARHPTISSDGTNDPNVMVFFGSGQYLVNADKTSTDDNYFYGVWDKGDNNLDEGDLVEQTYDNGFSERVLTRNPVNYAGGDYGWFIELPDSGERSVTNPVVRGSIVFFNSFVPVSDPCSVGGYGYRFAVNVVDGGSPDEVTVDTNGDGIIDDNDKVTDGSGNTDTVAAIRQEGFLPEPVFIEDIAYTAETPSKVAELPKPPTGRFGWQELIQ
ncbi:MAG: hypothetical protein GY935_14850 [Gammaproteobacteria bacterium]|nr:hypothetical protein [Gammaproteobacteria bacterium]